MCLTLNYNVRETALYVRQDKFGPYRIPLSIQVAAARDFCWRKNWRFPMATDEIYASKNPLVLKSMLIDLPKDTVLILVNLELLVFSLKLIVNCWSDLPDREIALVATNELKTISEVLDLLKTENSLDRFIATY